MSESREVAVRAPAALPAELTVEDVLQQVEKIQILMQKAMKENEHFGVIPGTEKTGKKTLLKPGAEKLCLMFQFAPEYKHEITQGPFTVISTCTLYHRPSGTIVATGSGMCSAGESKYAWRKADRVCPKCEKQGTVIKGKKEFGGGWLCWTNKGGCNAKWPDGAKEIEGQEVGRVANPDLADQYNTVLKMADKRALVAAVLNGTAASDIFTQDLEDIQENLQAEQARSSAANGPDQPDAKDTGADAPKHDDKGPSRARTATKPPKADQPVETTATTVSEASTGQDGAAADNIPTEMPAIPEGVVETGVITARHAVWLQAEAKATNAQFPAILKSFARKEVTQAAELNWKEFKLIAGTLRRRRELQGK